jgi:hypothetical protein
LVDRAGEAAPEPKIERREAKPARPAPTDHPFRGFNEERRAAKAAEPALAPQPRRAPPANSAFIPGGEEDDRTRIYVAPAPKAHAPEPDDIDDEFHCLEMADGQKRYVVSPVGLKIGRTAPADIIIPDPGVSREHCLVELAGDKLCITDLNSTNGTYVEGKRIDDSVLLKIGQVVRVGNVTLRHEIRTRASLAA